MRLLAKAALTASLAAVAAVTAAVPASAGPLGTCPGGEPTCVYFSGSFPVTNPVVIPGRTVGPTYVTGPRACNASGTECVATYFAVPGAMVDSNGNLIGTLTVPGLGVGVSGNGVVTAYALSAPTFTPTGSPVGVTAGVIVPDFLVIVTGAGVGYACGGSFSDSYGPLTVAGGGCVTTYTVRV